MTKHLAAETVINLLFLLVLLVLTLMFLPDHDLMLALRGCSVCSEWSSEAGRIASTIESLFSSLVLILRALGSTISGVPMVW